MDEQLLKELVKNIRAQIDRDIVGAKGINAIECNAALMELAEHCVDRAGQIRTEYPWLPMNQ